MNHWMLLEKANVYSYFYRKYKVQDNPTFWTEKLGDEIPLEKLKEIALQRVKRCKVQQILALEMGILKTANFDEILNALEEENLNRKRKIEKGEPIYGPKQFTSRTYFFKVFDNMVIKLKNELAKDALKPSESQLKLLQQNVSNTNKDITGFLIMQHVDNNYDAYIDDQMNAIDIQVNKNVYNKIAVKSIM